jgi:pimeloyl-ACP methyl ester carboxylesterase
MTMRPPPQMGPPRAAAADDQTSSGFAFAETGWDSYFDQRRTLSLTSGVSGGGNGAESSEQQTTEATFCVYTAGPLLQPEAEGRSPHQLAASVVPVYVLLHGGGLSSLSWGLVAGTLKRHGRPIVAYDFRAHGGSTGDESELTADQLCSDTIAVIEATVGKDGPLVIVGHSLGGAIAAKVSCTPELKDRVIAVAMVDIVESVAMNSLDRMEEMVARRPVSFRTHHDAVQWAIRTRMVSNPVSAAVSIPSLLAAQAEHERAAGQAAEKDAGHLSWRTNLQATSSLWPVRASDHSLSCPRFNVFACGGNLSACCQTVV